MIEKWRESADKRPVRGNEKISTKKNLVTGLIVSFSARKQKIELPKEVTSRRSIARIANLHPKRRL